MREGQEGLLFNLYKGSSLTSMPTCGLLSVFNIQLQTQVTSGDEIFTLAPVKYCRKAENYASHKFSE